MLRKERKMKKKVAIILGSFAMGGAETMVCELACHINKEKYDLQVICINGSCNSPLEQKLKENKIKVKYLNNITKVNIEGITKVWQELSSYKPDIIHTHISGVVFSIPWIVCHSTKFIHTVHTSPEKEFNKKIQFFLKILYKLGKGIMVTVSRENQLKTMEYFSLPIQKVKMVNNGVDINKFYKKNHNNYTFINVGRQDYNKNQIIIIKAFKQMLKKNKDIHLILVGDGNQHLKLKEYISRNKLNSYVTLPGMKPDVERYLSISDVYIQSSLYEGLPLSVLEAMAAKLPIISTEVGGLKDIIKGNGVLIPTNDIKKLTFAMQDMKDHKEKYKKMCQKSWEIVQDYSITAMTRNYEKIYDEFIK